LKTIRGFHFCYLKEIELPESIEVIEDDAFLHVDDLEVVRIRGNPNIRRFSGMRLDSHYYKGRKRKQRMIQFGRDAAISRFPMIRFGQPIYLHLADDRERRDVDTWSKNKQYPTFIQYSELSLKRFRGEFELDEFECRASG
jgi:hypothetical protein